MDVFDVFTAVNNSGLIVSIMMKERRWHIYFCRGRKMGAFNGLYFLIIDKNESDSKDIC